MARGIIRILYNLYGEGIEITCPICSMYSAGTDMAEKYGNGWRIPLKVLSRDPYVCRCGTKYMTNMQNDHWHLFIDIPEEIIDRKVLEKLIESKTS